MLHFLAVSGLFLYKKEIDTFQSSLLNIHFGYFLPLLPLVFPTLFLPWELCVCVQKKRTKLYGRHNSLFSSWVSVQS